MNQPLNLEPSRTDVRLKPQPVKALSAHALRAELRQAPDYATWAEAARALDRLSGRDKWKQRDISALYDYRTLRERVDHLKALRAAASTVIIIYLG